ncbi:hypothetical protein PoB_007475200 [Plakobranchus ocellatus]|uniref:Uncharacterized protein n=1 Tax=Plakobranchus ocellatus TaxID=259542 RepID=A0AAV4DW64_9GAST|nr:hypothetical protein PoB_007475200 [Plakobranchus ocellatus]
MSWPYGWCIYYLEPPCIWEPPSQSPGSGQTRPDDLKLPVPAVSKQRCLASRPSRKSTEPEHPTRSLVGQTSISQVKTVTLYTTLETQRDHGAKRATETRARRAASPYHTNAVHTNKRKIKKKQNKKLKIIST